LKVLERGSCRQRRGRRPVLHPPGRDAPARLAALAFAAHLPWNLVLLVGVWRSAAQSGVASGTATLARLAMLAWVVVLSLL
jgi:hypothetical protein